VPHYSRRPNHPTSISVRDFENPRKPQAKKTVTLWYTTKVFSLWETQRAARESPGRIGCRCAMTFVVTKSKLSGDRTANASIAPSTLHKRCLFERTEWGYARGRLFCVGCYRSSAAFVRALLVFCRTLTARDNVRVFARRGQLHPPHRYVGQKRLVVCCLLSPRLLL